MNELNQLLAQINFALLQHNHPNPSGTRFNKIHGKHHGFSSWSPFDFLGSGPLGSNTTELNQDIKNPGPHEEKHEESSSSSGPSVGW
jgi:hypothetical protein